MKKIDNVIVAILVFVLLLQNCTNIVYADSIEVLTPEIVLAENMDAIVVTPGDTATIKIPVTSLNYQARSPIISLVTKDMPFTLASKFELYSSTTVDSNVTMTDNKTNAISNYGTTFIKFNLKIDESAKIGEYELNLSFSTFNNYQKKATMKLDTPVIIKVENEKTEPTISVDKVKCNNELKAGNKFNMTLSLKNTGEINAKNVQVYIKNFKDDSFTPNYSQNSFTISEIDSNTTSNLIVPLKVNKAATLGVKSLDVTVKCKDSDGKSYECTDTIYLEVTGVSAKKTSLAIVKATYPSKLTPGTKFNLVTTLKNKGDGAAKLVAITIDGYSTEGIIPKYSSDLTVDSIAAGGNEKINIPLVVSKSATAGVKTLAVKMTYKDESGTALETTSNIYIDVLSADGVAADGKTNLLISDVTQSPSKPNAGGKVTVSFTVKNKSNIDVKDLKLSVTNLTNANFSPVKSEPYKYIEILKAGQKKQITLSFIVSDTITEGLNELDLEMKYKDAKGTEQTDTSKLYIRDVQNALGASQSKPKLIISDFSTSTDKLIAGKVFKFKFDILNTHSKLSANNIQVTLSSTDNVFSITNGSNSFYIQSIKPGETSHNEIEFKIKSDSVTKAYPIDIKFEYEYEGLKETVGKDDVVKDSVEATETINLQVLENARPVVNSITVGAYEPATVNTPTTLSFEFYNMGRSVLNNVMARVEGDFTQTGNMLYIGNVESGAGDIQEMEVTPTVEGTGKGTLIISYEDSNGETIEVPQEFEAEVGSAVTANEIPTNALPIDAPVAKKPIVKNWMFVLMQICIVALGIPLARKATLGLYKRKLRKKEEEEF